MTRLRKDGRRYARPHEDWDYYAKIDASNARFTREHRPFLLVFRRATARYRKAQAIYKKERQRLERERDERWQKLRRPSDYSARSEPPSRVKSSGD